MFTFAINSYLFGNNPYLLKLINILIHILNRILLFAATWLIFSSFYSDKGKTQNTNPYIPSLLVAAIWLLHPLNVSTVLYISQRMVLLSAFFTLLGIVFYCLARSSHSKQKSILYLLSTFIICWPLATLSKENGALLPAYLFLIECFFFKFKTNQIHRHVLITIFSTLVIIPAIAALIFLPAIIDWVTPAYEFRAFTLSERVFTEGRAIWLYISFIFLPITSRMGLFHDDFIISSSITDPITTLFSIVGLILLLLTSISLRKKLPVISWGILFFLTGHALESTIIPLEPVYEHRNYLASIGLLIPFCYYLSKLSIVFKSPEKLAYITLPIIIVLGVLTMERASYWGHPFLFFSMEADNHLQSPQANYEMGRLYAQSLSRDLSHKSKRKTYETAKKHFISSANNNPHFTGGLFGLIMMNSSLNIKTEDVWIDELANRLSIFPVSSMAINWILNLVNCHAKSTCAIDQDVIQRLLNSAESNQLIPTKRKLALLSAHAGFSANSLTDYGSAIKFAQDAIKLAPQDPLLFLNISQLYLATRQFSMAENALSKAETFDVHKQHTSSIKKSMQILISLQ